MRDLFSGALVVIPARWGSRRFPGKPLAQIAGKPMIYWVWRQACRARRVGRVLVATDDERIVRAVKGFGGETVRTFGTFASGTDRVASVARQIPAPLVVNLQGDEPLISSRTIDQVIEGLRSDRSVPLATAARRARSLAEWKDPQAVKVVVDRSGFALYFSRSAIPYDRLNSREGSSARCIHIGLYAFRRAFLLRFASLSPTPLERMEGLEQLRALEHGCPIRVFITPDRTWAVDRSRDIDRVESLIHT